MGGFLILAIAFHGVSFQKQWFWCEPSREPYLKQIVEPHKTSHCSMKIDVLKTEGIY